MSGDRGPWLADPSAAVADLLERSVLRCGWANDTRAPPGWRLEGRRIAEGHLLLVGGGALTYAVAGRPIVLRRGDAVLIAPGVAHDAWPDPAAWPRILTCRFACLRRDDGGLQAELPRPFAAMIRPGDPATVLGWLVELRRHWLAGSPFDRAACDGLVTRIVAALGASASGAGPLADLEIIRLCERLVQGLAEPWSLARMAAAARLSRKDLLRRFRRTTGSSPTAWLIDQRCKRGRELLAETTLTVGAIAELLGYPDAFTFSRQFRHRFGHPPRDYRLR